MRRTVFQWHFKLQRYIAVTGPWAASECRKVNAQHPEASASGWPHTARRSDQREPEVHNGQLQQVVMRASRMRSWWTSSTEEPRFGRCVGMPTVPTRLWSHGIKVWVACAVALYLWSFSSFSFFNRQRGSREKSAQTALRSLHTAFPLRKHGCGEAV